MLRLLRLLTAVTAASGCVPAGRYLRNRNRLSRRRYRMSHRSDAAAAAAADGPAAGFRHDLSTTRRRQWHRSRLLRSSSDGGAGLQRRRRRRFEAGRRYEDDRSRHRRRRRRRRCDAGHRRQLRDCGGCGAVGGLVGDRMRLDAHRHGRRSCARTKKKRSVYRTQHYEAMRKDSNDFTSRSFGHDRRRSRRARLRRALHVDHMRLCLRLR